MKTYHITLLAAVAASIAACAPYPEGTGPRMPGMLQQTPPESQSQADEVPAPTVDVDSSVPVGRPTPDGKKGMVISPYRPYNVIDVTGYRSGDIVGDPSTASVDPATGQPIPSTSKHFRIP
ncbi:hypothetical protein NT6N_33380 [Oceaniferula spumae]|uniref:Lipoprotein n=1 Tax=Oceaniferula spumae TaxID=2979115 RepID=A0AAT9FQP5_9BACT